MFDRLDWIFYKNPIQCILNLCSHIAKFLILHFFETEKLKISNGQLKAKVTISDKTSNLHPFLTYKYLF